MNAFENGSLAGDERNEPMNDRLAPKLESVECGENPSAFPLQSYVNEVCIEFCQEALHNQALSMHSVKND